MSADSEVSQGRDHFVRRAKCPVCQSYLDESGACPCCAARQLASERLKGVFEFFARLLGFDPPDGFNGRSFLSGILHRHSEGELEELLARGFAGGIPSLDRCSADWPSPWLFTRFLFFAVLAALSAHLGLQCWEEFNLNQLPAVIIADCALLPMSMMVFYFEMNVRRSVSLALLSGLFVVGGVVSLLFTAIIQPAFVEIFNASWLNASVAGLTEEPAKLFAVLVFVKAVKRRPYILDGLAMGAAVGAGFAVFESCGYAFTQFVAGLLQTQDVWSAFSCMMDNILLRAWISPFMHVTWTAIAAAGLFYVKGSSRFHFNMLVDSRFLRVFVVAVAMHMFWNTPWLFDSTQGTVIKALIMLVVEVPVVFTLIAAGLRQIRLERAYCQAHPGVVEEGMEWVPAVREQAEKAAATAAPETAAEEAPRASPRPATSVAALRGRQRRVAMVWLLGLAAFWIVCDRQTNGRWIWDEGAEESVAADAPEMPVSGGKESWTGRLKMYQLVADWTKGEHDQPRRQFESEIYPLLEQAYNRNIPDAIGDYGFLLYVGIFYEQNQSEGLAELKRAANLGSAEAAEALRKLEQSKGE